MTASATPFVPRMHSTRGGYNCNSRGNNAVTAAAAAAHPPRRVVAPGGGNGGYAAHAHYGSVCGNAHRTSQHYNSNISSNNNNNSSYGSYSTPPRITASRPLKQLLHHEIALIMLLFSMQSFLERGFGVGGPLSTEMIAGTRFTEYAKPSSSWWRQHDSDGFFASSASFAASSASFARASEAARRAMLLDGKTQTMLLQHQEQQQQQQQRAARGAEDDDDEEEQQQQHDEDDARATDKKSGDHTNKVDANTDTQKAAAAAASVVDESAAAARTQRDRFATNADVWDNVFSFLPWREVLRMRGVSTTHFRCSLAYVAICRMPHTKTPACFIPAREDFDAEEAAVEAALHPVPPPPPRSAASWQSLDGYHAAAAAAAWPPCDAQAGGCVGETWWTHIQPACTDDGLYGNKSNTSSSSCTLETFAAEAPAVARTGPPYDLTTTHAPPDVPSTLQRMFFGQLRRDGTVPMVRWLVHYVFDAPAWALHSVENHRHRRTALGKGCAWPTLADAATVSRLLDAHHRLFYDRLDGGVEGVWLVPHAHTHALAVEVAHRYVTRPHLRHMPRATFVAELSASSAADTNNTNAPAAMATAAAAAASRRRMPPVYYAASPIFDDATTTTAAVAGAALQPPYRMAAPYHAHPHYTALPPYHALSAAAADAIEAPPPQCCPAAHDEADYDVGLVSCARYDTATAQHPGCYDGEYAYSEQTLVSPVSAYASAGAGAAAATPYAYYTPAAYSNHPYEAHDDDDVDERAHHAACEACVDAVAAAETASVASSNGGNSEAAASTTTMLTTTTATAMTAAAQSPIAALPSYDCAVTDMAHGPCVYAAPQVEEHNAAIIVEANGMWRNNPYQPIVFA